MDAGKDGLDADVRAQAREGYSAAVIATRLVELQGMSPAEATALVQRVLGTPVDLGFEARKGAVLTGVGLIVVGGALVLTSWFVKTHSYRWVIPLVGGGFVLLGGVVRVIAGLLGGRR